MDWTVKPQHKQIPYLLTEILFLCTCSQNTWYNGKPCRSSLILVCSACICLFVRKDSAKNFRSIAVNEFPDFSIATDKALFSSKKCWYLSYFSVKTYVVGTHLKCLSEALLMSTHNICIRWEIRKILCGYPLLSVAMLVLHKNCTFSWRNRKKFIFLSRTKRHKKKTSSRAIIQIFLVFVHTLFLSKQKKYWYYDRRISCSSGFLKYSWKWECLRMFMHLFHHKVLKNDVLLVLTVWLMVILLTSSFSLNKKWKLHSCCLFSVASNCLLCEASGWLSV